MWILIKCLYSVFKKDKSGFSRTRVKLNTEKKKSKTIVGKKLSLFYSLFQYLVKKVYQ